MISKYPLPKSKSTIQSEISVNKPFAPNITLNSLKWSTVNVTLVPVFSIMLQCVPLKQGIPSSVIIGLLKGPIIVRIAGAFKFGRDVESIPIRLSSIVTYASKSAPEKFNIWLEKLIFPRPCFSMVAFGTAVISGMLVKFVVEPLKVV